MTRPPSLPPIPPPEPLDDAERTLARAFRNLPTGMPSPELDARILGAARRAVHLAQPRRRDRRWVLGLGTAATAVLAVGVMFRMHDLGRDAIVAPPTSEEIAPAPAAANKPSASPASEAADNGAHAEMQKTGEARPNAEMPPPPAMLSPERARAMPPPPKDMQAQREQQIPDGVAAKSLPDAFPAAPAISAHRAPVAARPYAPPPPPVAHATSAPMAVMAPPPAPAAASVQVPEESRAAGREERSAAIEARAPSSNSAPAAAAIGALSGQPLQAKTSGNAAADMASGQVLDQITVTGSRIKRADASDKDALISTDAVLPGVDDDVKLAPMQWIERIRERMRSGDRANAVASLHGFMRKYPDASLPDDLLSLLR